MKKPHTRSMRFYHVAHLIKRIEILFISFDSMFQDYFLLYFFFQCFKTTICFILFNISRLFFSHTHKKLFPFSFTIFTFTPLYTYAYNPLCYPISNTLKQKTISFTFNFSMTPM